MIRMFGHLRVASKSFNAFRIPLEIAVGETSEGVCFG